MSELFSAYSDWVLAMVIQMGSLYQRRCLGDRTVEERFALLSKLLNLCLSYSQDPIPLTELCALEQVLSPFSQMVEVNNEIHLTVTPLGISFTEVCLFLYGVVVLLKRKSSEPNYSETDKYLVMPLRHLEIRLEGFLGLYKSLSLENQQIISRKCLSMRIEREKFLSCIIENFHLVCFFAGKYMRGIYLKMLGADSIEQVLPKTEEGDPETCSVCLSLTLTSDSDFTVLDSCCHVVCTPCAITWFKERRFCPVCRAHTLYTATKAQFEHFKKHQNLYRLWERARAATELANNWTTST